MPAYLPTSLPDWEVALTQRFLAAAGEGIGPIRSFDISAETLALSAGVDPSFGDQVVASFKKALLENRSALYAALEDGIFNPKLATDCPGCFAYLALTIFVDSQLAGDDTDGSREFRPKLAAFLNVDRSFSKLSGVASMWKSLRDWLTCQTKSGKPFRKLILPNDDGWVQIGHSVRLSFPSRRDYAFLGSFFDQHPGITADERAMLGTLRNLVDRSSASPGLHEAFDEFHDAYLSGRRTLADHRFWRFVLAVAEARNLDMPVEVSLEIYPDEDGLFQFTLDLVDKPDRKTVHSTLQSAVEACGKLGVSNLRKVAEAGYVVFKRVGTARWSAVSRFSDCRGEVKVGLCPQVATAVGTKLGRLQSSGDWSLTVEPVAIAKVEDALRRMLAKGETPSLISGVTVTGGVRSGHHWLGRRTLLPKIETDLELPTISTEGDAAAAAPICEEIEPNVYAIKSEHPLAGAFELRSSATIATRLQFVADAFIHDARPPTNVLYIPEWDDTAELRSQVGEPPRCWDHVPEPLDDLLEAVYAGGRRGWSESDLVSLLERTLPAEINRWDFLRSLQDATALRPFLRVQFRGRSWMLGPVALVPLRSRTQDFILVDGCIPVLQLRDFRRAVEGLGGRPFRRMTSPWSVPLIGAVGGSVEKLSETLGWPTKQATMPGRRPAAFDDAPLRRLDAYQHASTWSWEAGRFTTDRSGSPVRLARWVHLGERDHDVYVVSGPTQERRFLSRCSAIVHAHMLAGRAMYRFEDGALVRLGLDGHLPDRISEWLRYENLTNVGPLASGGYGYAARQDQATTSATLLPGAIDAGVTLRASWDVIASARRSGFAERLVFTDGHFVSGRMPFGSAHGSSL
jgi:hypothetical protein